MNNLNEDVPKVFWSIFFVIRCRRSLCLLLQAGNEREYGDERDIKY